MKIREAMSKNPACCTAKDSAQNVAKIMCDANVRSIPVVIDHQHRSMFSPSRQDTGLYVMNS